MAKENNQTESLEIIKSLEDLISICQKINCQFRIFGSLVIAALKGDFYRKIGDIDCCVNNKFKKELGDELEKKGYLKLARKDEDIPWPLYFIGFKTENFLKDGNKISLLFVSFKEDYLEIPLRFGFSFRVPYNLISKTYQFYGKEFKGLIPEAALFNLTFLKDKLKRETDFKVLFLFCNLDIIQKIKKSDTFFWFGKRVPLISAILASRTDKILKFGIRK